MRDTLQTVVPTGACLAFVNLVGLEVILQILLILTTIAYTIWRWRRDARKARS
jgi:hypothetical protein